MIKTLIHYRKPILTEFLATLGTLMLIWEASCLFIPDGSAPSTCCKIIVGVLILFASVAYAWYQIIRKPDSIELKINKRAKLSIQLYNLMDAPGMKVIPVNEYFDTHNGDGIINPRSLHGQLNALFADNIEDLRNQIDTQLATMDQLPQNRVRSMVAGLPSNRYPLGTCVRVRKGEQTYMLVALTRFNTNEHVEVSTEEYPEIIRKMFNGIEQLNDGNPVYLPLMGSGISGYQLTEMQMLNTIVRCAHNADTLGVTNGITLCLYNQEQLDKLNLNVIKYLYNRYVTLD